jgi:G3E family GTPase
MNIPVTIISGFLGAGKTTFLLPWIAELKRQSIKPYVIVNEMGPLDVDGSILSKLHPDVNVHTITSGCLCCNRKSELGAAIQEAVQSKPDRIIIELTGIANPVEILDRLFEEDMQALVRVDHIIGLLDASVLLSNEPMLINPCLDSIRVADHIILNKMDRVSNEYRKELENKIAAINPAPRDWAQQARIDTELLQQWCLPAEAKKRTVPVSNLNHTRMNSAHLNIPVHPFLTAIKVEGWLKKFALHLKKNALQPGRIIRAKGYIRLAGEEQFYLYQYANGYHEWQLVNAPPVKDSYLIVIGHELNQAELQQDFNDHFPAW